VIALRLIGFSYWTQFLQGVCGDRNSVAPSGDEVAIADGYASVVDMVARNLHWALVTCLPRSITLWWLLRRRGIATELQIGVRKNGERIEAHAWVVCCGKVIGEAMNEQFLFFDSARLLSQGSILTGVAHH
jgi:hypothetical protein